MTEIIPVEAKQKLQERSLELVKEAAEQQVINEQDATKANDLLITLNKGLKELEKKRKSFTQPQNEALRNINGWFKEITKPINEAKNALSNRLMEWRKAERERIEIERKAIEETARKEAERRRKIQEAHKEKGHNVKEEITPVVITEPVPFETKDTTKTRKNWTFEIINKSDVPESFKNVDTAMIRNAMRAAEKDENGRPQIDIPGVKVYCEEIPIYA